MGRFPYNGKMAKSPCGGHPWLCVHPGGGRGELFRAYPIRGSQQPAGWGKVLVGPLEVQADARSGLLVSALTCLLGAHPVASGPLGSPFLAVVGHMSLRVPDTVNWRSGSQTNTPPGCDLAQSWRRAQPQGEAQRILSDRMNE